MAQRTSLPANDAVLTYLGRVADATATLCLEENQDTCQSTTPATSSGDEMIRQIAQQLLQACNPKLLLSPLPPPLVEVEEKKKASKHKNPPLMDPEEEEDRIPDWKTNRSDYLRKLLRGLPPIALDVAAHICSILLVDEKSIPKETAAAALLLFSKWLPIAPQLAPLVSDLFALQVFDCPFDYGTGDDDKLQLLMAEAAHGIYEFYAKRGEHSTVHAWWDWGHLITMLIKDDDDVVMSDDLQNDYRQAIRWHAARAIGFLIDLRPCAFAAYLDRLQVRMSRVPWMPHPWIVDKEEERAQFRFLKGLVSLWDFANDEFPAVSAEQVRAVVSLHSLLVHVGDGIVLVKNHGMNELVADGNNAMELDSPRRAKQLILTPTTCQNLALLGAAMCTDPYPLPILVCGPPGSGKSTLVRELAHYCCSSGDDLLELHVDEETDSKTLIGSYTTTDVPGEFTWRPGALTQAVRSGKWVLMEDVDSVPMEIQAAIVQLLEDRMLPLGGGKFEPCHPKFRLFGTCTTNPDYRIDRDVSEEQSKPLRLTGKKLLNPSLWRKVHVQPLAFSELKQVGESLHPSLPSVVMDAALNVLKVLDKSGRSNLSGSEMAQDSTVDTAMDTLASTIRLTTGRHASVRDFLKLLSRISHTVAFEHNVSYATEAQRTLCLAETVDVFAASCPSLAERREFITQVAAPCWGVTGELALNYMDSRQPSVTRGSNYTEIGRARIPHASLARQIDPTSEKFAPTNFSLRLMESIAVCVTENEPTLLVGETGCGKTTLLQQLARYAGRDLIVQNLSLQTDSTDLLGGYRPLEIPHIARKVYLEFVDLFVATFSRKQNADFLKYAASVLQKKQWKKLAQCFTRAAALGLSKLKERSTDNQNVDPTVPGLSAWRSFDERAEQFERQRLACDSGLAFAFTEGALVEAIRSGKWVLLDEINLASSETLQRLCGLLDDSTGSVTLTERGDSYALKRHPDFRLFAAMNPATDAGKKDLPPSIRARFSELYVDELLDAVELRTVAAQYLRGVVSLHDAPLERTETIGRAVDVYLQCRDLAEQQLVDSSGHKPRYTMRTMCRALSATRNLVLQQKLALNRSLLEGFELAFEGALDASSTKAFQRTLRSQLGKKLSGSEMDHPPRRPSSGGGDDHYVLVKPFWIKAGPIDLVDWSEQNVPGRSKFILTESMTHNLRRLSRAVAAGPWPVLLEGPTSAGKTTLVEYLAARCGHEVVRINNHEHTDVQEYTGGYSSDANGSLSFHDGILVRALRRGHWVILDELNLAPSEVLEALNRLLDDNRELYLPETDETVRPHPNFRLFATQNPSGAYGGRKPLSRAFRNRFVELHMGDIPAEEMKIILEKRCACPPSHAKALVKTMVALRQRRNSHGVFLGKDGLITPRDLLRWAERGGSSKLALAQEGYMLLAERLRNEGERSIVKEEIESHLGVAIDCDKIYYGDDSEARALLAKADLAQRNPLSALSGVAPTKSLLRLLTLVLRCVRQKEPVLLVGDTGCGKTTVVQLLEEILDRDLHIINCHATTETSDLVGGLRPVRGRGTLSFEIHNKLREFLSLYPDEDALDVTLLPKILSFRDDGTGSELDSARDSDIPEDTVPMILSSLETLWDKLNANHESTTSVSESSIIKDAKKRKLASGIPLGVNNRQTLDEDTMSRLKELVDDIKSLARRLSSLFEWSDGPLVHAMRSGQLLLLDEMSLAEDAVLERLNSVLEPSRTLVLAEKGTDSFTETDGNTVSGHADFRIFATMNPGGDFGKRELSPALRSRFTEIWVPQVTDPSDIEMVLSHTLDSVAVRCDRELLKKKILNYVNFFNVTICGNELNPCSDLALSLRDVLAWARFIVDVSNSNDEMDPWALYCHGACLMHLDGLGLGTGMSLADSSSTKRKAIAFLLDQVPVKDRSASETSFSADLRKGLITEKRFGIYPFTIETGLHPIPDSTFDFGAPTPSLNLMRVLRAMQISKPILLEGSPGVGKTSLAAALAAASGHRLVRINLSEQTDMADLMGSDLPYSDRDGENGSSTPGSSFRWCDGVLLRAIKKGDWVLLDELNLASQSVLEGLNSCLDHRASVFIPELGKTFQCPPTFRIFAAQNPLAQGGGRKGLPKSFLNRFTKVYIEPLTEEDLHSIVCSRFPLLSVSLAESMILFNKRIHEDVGELREYGASGSPWEFNLRDVFRWCELVVASGDGSEENLARFARHLYLQRFRSLEDRQRLDHSYQECFGMSLFELPLPEVSVTNERVSIGGVVLERQTHSLDTSSGQLFGSDNSIVVRSLLNPLEAIASCVTMKWPCLLVGVSGSGKSSLLNSVAELCSAPLVNVSLTPATDVNELVGSFEQVDAGADRKEAIHCLRLLRDGACAYLTESEEECMLQLEISRRCRSIDYLSLKELVAIGFEIDSLLSTAFSINQQFQHSSLTHREAFREALTSIEIALTGKSERNTSHFRWVDGILVTAMKRGYWLHLENVNLCPASVLDRLNPVMEKDGELLLTECGVQDSDASGTNHQAVKQHPNFRVFLSMNPEHGEISRAMRNRCVEISLLPSSGNDFQPSPTGVVDKQDSLHSTGVRSAQLAESLLELHGSEAKRGVDCGSEAPSMKHLRECGHLVRGLSGRGQDFQSSLGKSGLLSYELSEKQPTLLLEHSGRACSALARSPCLRWEWSFSPDEARLDLEMGLIKVWAGWDHPPADPRNVLPTTLVEAMGDYDIRNQASWFSVLQRNFLVLYLAKSSASDLASRSKKLDGYEDSSSGELRFMTSLLVKAAAVSPPSPAGSLLQDNVVLAVQLYRYAQLVEEEGTYRRIAGLDHQSIAMSEMSAIEASFCLSEGRIDRSSVSCPITPVLYPLFRAIDKWIYHLLAAPESDAVRTCRHTLQQLESFLLQRDQLWRCLKECTYRGALPSNFLGFDESGFIVQWIWLKKRLFALSASSAVLACIRESMPRKLRQQIDVLNGAIDRVLFDTGDGLSRSADTLWKKGGHPLVPRKAGQWEAMALLNRLSQDCVLSRDSSRDEGGGPVIAELHDLIENSSPVLFLDAKAKGELLAGLCTCFWVSTEEAQGGGGGNRRSLENEQLCTAVSEQLGQRRRTFEAQVRASKVDTKIDTVENLLDLETLSSLKEGAQESSDPDEHFLYSLLLRFAQIQVSPLAEFWCIREEAALIETLTRVLVTAKVADAVFKEVKALVPRFRRFIDVALTRTCLSVVDIRPYQTLLWVVDGTTVRAESVIQLLRCLILRMMAALSRHKWHNSFNDLNAISDKLEMPLWVSDEISKFDAGKTNKREEGAVEFRQGPPGLNQRVKTEVIFRLVGSDISSMFKVARKSSYATIENHAARKEQARNVFGILSTLTIPDDGLRDRYQVQYLFAHVVEALVDFFPNGSGKEVLSLLWDADALRSADESRVCDLLAECEHPIFRECVESSVFPLVSSLRSLLNGVTPRENRALCWVYVGLLRMNLLVPRSPLDPGKKPIAKVVEHDRYLGTLEGKIVARRLDSLFVRGVPIPDDPSYRGLLKEMKKTKEKRSKQERKRVERVPSAPPFIDLFRESRRFLQTTAAPEGVPALVRVISEASQDEKKAHAARSREYNWQVTSSSFCSRVLSHFAPYEDVCLPFVNAVQNLRDGVRLLAEYHLTPGDPTKALQAATLDSLLAFPSGNHFAATGVSALIPSVGILAGASHMGDLKRCRFALSLALLCRIDIQKRLRGMMSHSALMESHSVFNSVASSWSLSRDGTKGDSPENAEALLEEEYREQFPNHGTEFHALLNSIEVGGELDYPEMEQSEIQEEDWQLADDQIAIFCSLHKDLYLAAAKLVDDQSRTRALCAAYSAAYHLAEMRPIPLTESSDTTEEVGAHISTLALCSGSSNGVRATGRDFHRDANPEEVVKASRPLERLISRTSQLLTAFPGHSVLIALVRVANHVRKLPLSTTSVGKTMHGLEIILRKAQEWEQHASSLVQLGTSLKDVSDLVANWRKLELQSWGTLLDARELRFAKRARRHWPRLYKVLIRDWDQMDCLSPSEQNGWDVGVPDWVWKGLRSDMGTFASTKGLHEVDEALHDLSKVMDTFLLSSSLGEFKERLDLVEAFANQISLMTSDSRHAVVSQLKVATMLSSLLSFYRQFLPMLETRLSELRRPIEARLKDEVKLAKWDEQSYYALKESAEKNHRKLMRLLREYDDVLELSVSSILERHLCHGVRPIESTAEEPCSSIPPYKVLFPFIDSIMGANYAPTASLSLVTDGRSWGEPEKAGLYCDKYVSRMGHYARRMASLLRSRSIDGLTWSSVGSENASFLCDSIFERIESLRKENTTKTMKQRALVDLFKTLKKNGFLHTKWSVPAQVREMANLFQLPGLGVEGVLPAKGVEILEGAESYFQRTTAEVNRLRSEVLMLGSKHMSQRETQIMLSLSEHGLTMLCQQRCVIARLMRQISSLDRLTGGCDRWEGLPVGQTKLRRTLEDFSDAFLSVVENLKQLQLLMKTVSPLVEEPDKVAVIRDMVSVVDSCISSLQGYRASSVPQIVTAADISSATEATATLEEVSMTICGLEKSCEKNRALPPEVFTSCILEIRRACSISSSFSDQVLSPDIGDAVEASTMMDGASLVVQRVLLAVQVLCNGNAIDKTSAESEDTCEEAIFGCHSSASAEIAAIDLDSIVKAASAMSKTLQSIHETNAMSEMQRDCCTSVASSANALVRNLLQVSKQSLVDYIKFSRSLAKLNFVLVRVFRVLVSKGYCADNITDDADGDGEGDISGMNFEDDKEGTGMGEGDGKQDVTDQLESEEQLLGLKGQDQDDNPTEQQESRELNEEEAKQGMEMEGDFEGEMFDVPEQSQNDDEEDENDEEEVDREMGDGPDQNEDIIDEKMWDQSDDEGDQDRSEEKFEKDSGVKGESVEDELRTREDDVAQKEKGGDAPKEEPPNEAKPNDNDSTADADETMQDEPEINEDLEDKYEEKASGIDVRDEQNGADEENEGDDDPMELEDNMNLDEGGDAETEEGGDTMETEDQIADEPAEDDAADADVVAEDGEADADSVSSEVDPDLLESGGHKSERNQDAEESDENDNTEDTAPEAEFSGKESAPQPVQGVQASDGKDSIMEKMDEDEHGDGNDGKDDNDDAGDASESQPQASAGGTSGDAGDTGDQGESFPDGETDDKQKATVSAPNPFKNPGDASKFWHKKLRMLDGSSENTAEEPEASNGDDERGDGEFEFAPKDQASSTQVLGEADEEEAAHIDDREEERHGDSDHDETVDKKSSPEAKETSTAERKRSKNTGSKSGLEPQKDMDEDQQDESDAESNGGVDLEEHESEASENANDVAGNEGDDKLGNRVVTDLSQLSVGGSHLVEGQQNGPMIEDEGCAMITDADVAAARAHWSEIQGQTHHLARRLCEKLRLVMEPLVATKLKGDYRTGKRINMKRVIGYIASGYRKDKIWLRRTKPAKRNYRVLLAVDNSESMHKSGAGEMALAAMATLAVGMQQLEIGELGVASFGEEMRLLHPFHQPFTSESGVNVVQNFPFDEKRTRTALCVESALSALESHGDTASMQLVFLISDGRIERDSRDTLRRLVREMVERNVLLVMIIVEGDKNGPTKKKDSIVHMKEVTFKNGKPTVKQFIEDYPFPYYMVLEDMQSLPETLGEALRQWFEMIAQMQGSSR